jgi:hypothetical protein
MAYRARGEASHRHACATEVHAALALRALFTNDRRCMQADGSFGAQNLGSSHEQG